MFRPIPSPLSTFRGFRLRTFQQGRCNVAARALRIPIVRFAPALGCAGLFIPAGFTDSLGEPTLQAEWERAGKPSVRLPAPNECLLFGRPIPWQHLPYAGYDDLWLDAATQTLLVATRRDCPPERLRARLEAFAAQQLLLRAQALAAAWAPRLRRAPQRIVLYARSPRILGQCTRAGEIRLNPSLIRWPESVLAETLAHELTHLVHFNHSPAFWRALSELYPDWLAESLVHYLL